MIARPGDNLALKIGRLQEGDVLELLAGEYPPLRISEHARPISISGKGAVFHGGENALRFDRCGSVTLEGLTVREGAVYGLFVTRCASLTARGVTALTCGKTGILTGGGTGRVELLNCNASGSKLEHGAYISEDCQRVRVIGGTYADCARSGIQINGEPGWARDVEVRQVLCSGNQHGKDAGAGAIQCGSVQGGRILNCTVLDHHGRAAVVLYGKSSGVLVDGCHWEHAFAPGAGEACVEVESGSSARLGPLNVGCPGLPLVLRG